jgi:alpha-glucosidase (family GH31 glycosyl hydrolase)
MRKLYFVAALAVLTISFSSCKKDKKEPEPTEVQTTPWPSWVFKHWVWEGEGTTQSARQIVDDYLANGIDVGAIIIDSPWETAYNSFEWDNALYPDAQGMIDYFHSKNIKVLCWITGGIDTNLHPLYDYALSHDFFMKKNASSGPAVVRWWKPTPCSLIDLYNPEAVAWWKSLMDKTLAYGIDGWKCDGSDFLLLSNFPNTYYYSPYLQGNIPSRNDYSEKYYRLFHDYTREKLGIARVVMCRPVDNYGYTFLTGSSVAFCAKDMCWAGWVGDQDATFDGLKVALNNMYESAAIGYMSYGSDIGGYRTDAAYPATGRSKELLIRWAQVGAFSGLMENGGGGEHRPWMFDQETNTIYKNLVTMRNKYLVSYLLDASVKANAQEKSITQYFNKTDYSYMFGDDIFVAPVLNTAGTVTINFPAGSKWVYLHDKTEIHEGGTSITKTYPLNEFPVFMKEGSAIAGKLVP